MVTGSLLFYSDFSGCGIAGDQITGEPWASTSHRINSINGGNDYGFTFKSGSIGGKVLYFDRVPANERIELNINAYSEWGKSEFCVMARMMFVVGVLEGFLIYVFAKRD